MNINNTAVAQNTYDAIVVGSGISGGWAAKELCQKGLKTLLLDRGRNVEHIKDYPTANMHPWEFKYGMNHTTKEREENPLQCFVSDPADKHFFASDKEHPYVQVKPFNWIRGYQVGGRSLTWGRQCYRLSDLDFEANAKEGVAIDWPIRYKDIAPWYDYVESYIGVSGSYHGLPHLPDGKFLPALELNTIEKHLAQTLKNNYDRRMLIMSRIANLTRGWEGRGPCLNRNLCARGCPFGGYFSSNSATIPAAAATGNLTLRPFSVVSEIIYDEKSGKATGVRVIDTNTKESIDFYARIIFLNASTIATAGILLKSTSHRFPNGFGNGSDQVGRNLMDHHSVAGAEGEHEGYHDMYYRGRRPAGFYIPRFRNLPGEKDKLNFTRGYGIQGHGERKEWIDRQGGLDGVGKNYKEQLTTPGNWTVWMAGWGECLPYSDNRVMLDEHEKDQWGLPLVKIDFSFRENEMHMMADQRKTCADMLEKAGFKNVSSFKYPSPGGSTIHEMGTARMGKDPKTSVLNEFNQMHEAKNVFITDGSFMTSSATQNPSLTYMAMTARACDYAVSELKKGNL